jgi:predicted aspartyl protease
VPIEGDGFHLMITVNIGRRKANMLVDTGASRTVFDVERIKQFTKNGGEDFEKSPHLSTGLGTNSLESHMTILSSLKIGEVVMKKYNAVLLDLSHVNQSYTMLELPLIDGVIGSDLLYQYSAVIDFKQQRITFECGK